MKNIFLSYCHTDEAWKNKLVSHLKILQKQKLCEIWHDRDIRLLEEFFDNRISAAEFEERGGGHKKAGAGENARETPDYDTLAKLLKNGELIPFLGPGVLRLAGSPPPVRRIW